MNVWIVLILTAAYFAGVGVGYWMGRITSANKYRTQGFNDGWAACESARMDEDDETIR